MDVFTTAKPCAARAAVFENMSEAALNHLAALAHGNEGAPNPFAGLLDESVEARLTQKLLQTIVVEMAGERRITKRSL